MSQIRRLIRAERRRQGWRLLAAGLCGAGATAAAVLLLGISGWFITGAALAGAGGAMAASSFNTLLPSAGIRLFAILRTGCRYGERLIGHDAALRSLARLRPALFRGLAASPPARALGLSTGEAVARMVQDVDEIEARFVRESSVWGMIAGGAAGTILWLAGGPVLASALAVLAVLVIAARRLGAVVEERGRAVPARNGRLKDEIANLAASAAELRAYGLEEWAADRVLDHGTALVAAQQRATAAGGGFEWLQASAVGLAAMLALGLSRAAPLPLAALAALGAAMMVDGAAGFVRGLQRQGQLRAAEARLDSVFGTDSPAVMSRPSQGRPPMIELPGNPAPLLPGSVVGISGPSGRGKTTLIEQLVGLRETARGRIRLGGIDLAEMDPQVSRRCFSLAPQDASLLAGTVMEILLLAAPRATEAEIWDALHAAALDECVRGLPDGLNTWLGENGARLSGGERRRLSLARAFLRPAPWLLLDEPTEGLDARTEAVVVERLAARLTARGQGALIVSHRPAPLAICGEILIFGAELNRGAPEAGAAWRQPPSEYVSDQPPVA